MQSILTGVALALALLSPASTAGAVGLSLGLKGGLSLSHVNADLFDTDNRSGFVGCVHGRFDLTPMIGVSLDSDQVRTSDLGLASGAGGRRLGPRGPKWPARRRRWAR